MQFDKIRDRVQIREAQVAQRNAILEALGGPPEWQGFANSEEILSFLRDRDPAYRDVGSVPALVARLNVRLTLPVELVEAAREADRDEGRRLDEFLEAPSHRTFLAENR